MGTLGRRRYRHHLAGRAEAESLDPVRAHAPNYTPPLPRTLALVPALADPEPAPLRAQCCEGAAWLLHALSHALFRMRKNQSVIDCMQCCKARHASMRVERTHISLTDPLCCARYQAAVEKEDKRQSDEESTAEKEDKGPTLTV